MNMQPHADPLKTPQEIWEDFSLSFTPAVREVVEFAKHIPGFSALSQNDQVALLKAGTFEVKASHRNARVDVTPWVQQTVFQADTSSLASMWFLCRC